MAGARIERVSSIFKRVEGLYKGCVIGEHELPIWFSVYQAFPPKLEPTMERPTPPSKVKNLIYPEDYIRGNFMKTYDHKNTKYVRLDDPKTLTDHVMDKYVNCFIEVSQRDDGKDAKEVVAAVEAMLANDGIVLTRKLVEGRNKKKS